VLTAILPASARRGPVVAGIAGGAVLVVVSALALAIVLFHHGNDTKSSLVTRGEVLPAAQDSPSPTRLGTATSSVEPRPVDPTKTPPVDRKKAFPETMAAAPEMERPPVGPTKPPAPVAASPFERLATIISNPYGRKGTRLDEPRRNFEEIALTLQELKSCSDPVVVASAQEMEAGRKAVAEVRASQNKAVDRVNRGLMETGIEALRGDYIVTERRDVFNRDGRLVGQKDVEVNYGNDVIAANVFVLGLSAFYGASNANAEALQKSEAHRMAAWKGLEPHLPKYYPRARVDTNLVTISIVPPEPARRKAGRFTAINVSGQRLSNVALRVDLAHYETYPESNVRQFYYVPAWEPGESLQFATNLTPNLATGANREPVPLEGPVVDRAHPNPNAWPRGVGGVIQARVEVWSDQAHQLERSTRFDANATSAGTWEIKQAFNRVGTWMRSENMRSRRNNAGHESFVPERVDVSSNARATGKAANGKRTTSAMTRTQPSNESVTEATQRIDRVIQFAPIDSQAYKLAQAFLKDPQGSTIDWSRQQLSELNQSIESRTFIKSLADAHSTPTRCAVLMSVNPSDSDGQNAKATIWMADDPSDNCSFSGKVDYDPTTMGPVMRLMRGWAAPTKSQKVNPKAQPVLPAPQHPDASSRFPSIGDELSRSGGGNKLVLTPDETGFRAQFGPFSIGFVGVKDSPVSNADAPLPAGGHVFFIQQHNSKGQHPGEPLTVDQLVRADSNGTPTVIREGKLGTMRAVSVSGDGTVLLFETDNSELIDPLIQRVAVGEKTFRQGIVNRNRKKTADPSADDSKTPEVKPRIVMLRPDGSVVRTVDLSGVSGLMIGSPFLLPDHQQIGFTLCMLNKSKDELPGENTLEVRQPRGRMRGRIGRHRGQTSPSIASNVLSCKPMVATVDLEGSNLKIIGPGAMPRWSADGKTILFSAITLADEGTGSEIEMRWAGSRLSVMDADGKNAHPIADEGTFDGAYSPDGKRIAFVSIGARNAMVGICNADGSDRQRLEDIPDSVCSTPRWLPATIAFRRQIRGSRSHLAQQKDHDDCVWIMGLEGDGLHRASHDTGKGRIAGLDFDAQRLSSLLTGKALPPRPDDPRVESLPPGQKFVFEGTKVFIRDASGHRTPAPDGDYLMFGGRYVMHVRNGNKWIK
jgi:WD40-like Beta Propeller Repeat